jgi:RHS repeat-associated protein
MRPSGSVPSFHPARMTRLALPKFFLLTLLIGLYASSAPAQIANVTNDQSTPIPGAGHDYIHLLSETVNPSNGSVSIRIQPPMPKGRNLTIPFAFAYDSNGVHHLIPHGQTAGPGSADWRSNLGYLSQGGWSYSVPMLSEFNFALSVPFPNNPNSSYTCNSWSNYMFYDPAGGRHALNLGTQLSGGAGPCNGPGSTSGAGGDSNFKGVLPNSFPDPMNGINNAPNPVTVFAKDGTVYTFPAPSHNITINGSTNGIFGLATTIEDRNGNQITSSDTGNGVFNFVDTTNRQIISSNGFGPTGTTNTVTVGGLAYQVTWKTITSNYPVVSNQIVQPGFDCSPPPAVSESQVVISQIALPNGKSYKFFYGTDNPDPNFQNPYGLLSEIDYPTGGSVKYKWGVTNFNEVAIYPGRVSGSSTGQYQKDGCTYQYKNPVVVSRTVVPGGSSNTLTQAFTYSTTWTPTGVNAGVTWTQKETDISATEGANGQVAVTQYFYAPVTLPLPPLDDSSFPGQVPVEQTTKYFNWGAGTTPPALRTVAKTWYDQYNLANETTTLDNNAATQKTYCYVNPTAGSCTPASIQSQLHEVDEFSFGNGAPGGVFRRTVTDFQALSNTPGLILDRPCRTTIFYVNGPISETDSYFDGAASNVAPCSPIAAAVPTNGPSGFSSHDAALGPTSTTPRGNVTTQIQKCFVVNGPTCTDAKTTYTYDEAGSVLSTIDPTQHTTTYSFVDNYSDNPTLSKPTYAYLTSITYPATGAVSHTESFSYAYSDGQLTSSKDQNNLLTSYLYADSLRRLTETDLPDNGKTTLAYNDTAPNPTITTSKLMNSAQSITAVAKMDGVGRTIQTQLTSDPQGTVFTDTAYYGMGTVLSVSNPYRAGTDPTSSSGTTTFTYDALKRKLTEAAPDGAVTQTQYCGQYTKVTDPAGKWRRSRTDAAGNLIQVDEPNSSTASVGICPSGTEPIWTTTYAYTALDKVKQIVQNGTRTRTFTYDSFPRLLTSSNPEVGTITYAYNPDSTVATKTDARGIITTYSYDALHREISRTYSNLDPTVTTNYDQSNCLGLSSCSNIGHRTSVTDASGSEAWAYQVDKANSRSLHVDQRTTTSGTLNITKSTQYILDLAGNITQITYPSGRVVNYAFDTAGRPKSATDSANGITYATGFQTPPGTCPTSGVCYTPQGSFYALSIGQTSTFTGLNLNHSYNNRLQPLEFKASSSGGNAMDISYGYLDPATNKNAGHVFSITNSLDTTRSQTFSYDQVNRLTAAQTTSTFSTSPAHCWGETYNFNLVDPYGNLQAIAATTNPSYTGCSQESGFSRTADINNHLSGFTYDAAGNTANDGTFAYTWDGESQLKSAGGVTYTYDADGRRAAKVGNKLYWYGSGGEILSETDAAGDTISDYVFFGGKRIASVSDNSISNAGFEQGIQNWISSGAGTAVIVTDSTRAHSGNNYLLVTEPPMTPPGLEIATNVAQIPVSVGQTITVGGWRYQESGASTTFVGRWVFSVVAQNGGQGGHPPDDHTLGVWQLQVMTYTVPSFMQCPCYAQLGLQVIGTTNTPFVARFDDGFLNVGGAPSGGPLYHIEDSLGTSRVITQSNGAVCYDADFYPYGGERPYTNTCPQPYKFEGKERDAETGNDDFGARYYSNRFGRWLSADWSAVPVAVPYANLSNPQTLNLYSMVADDPETFADLDGHCAGGGPPICVNDLKRTYENAVETYKAYSEWSDEHPVASAAINGAVALGMTLLDLPPEMEWGSEAGALRTGSAGLTEAPSESTGSGGNIIQNAAKGKAFQNQVFAEAAATDPGAVQNVTVKTQTGVKTVIDVVSKDTSGATTLTEAKSSGTARLSPNQAKAHPEIARSGATVVGKGKPGYPGGTKFPPTKVNVVRPPANSTPSE